MKHTRFAVPLLALTALAACNTDRSTGPDAALAPELSRSESASSVSEAGNGVVYVLSNQTSGNQVLTFTRSPGGELTAAAAYDAGGVGTGAGLGSQNAVILTQDGRLLFAVNSGSNTVSSFRVGPQGLVRVSTVASGGTRPISLTAANGLLYVLNDGGAGNIAGLRYTSNGALTPLANSSRPLSSGASVPAQIEFTPAGNQLIVTEKGTNTIASYAVDANGLAQAGEFFPSSGQTPFGFAFRRNTLIVAEAFGGAPDASAASSYRVGDGTPVFVLSATVPTTETAACWFAVSNNGQFAYTTNTGSGTVTAYAISSSGRLTRLRANGESAVLGAGTAPADLAFSQNGRFLYTRNGGTRTISAIRVRADGSLEVLSGGITGLPAGTVGLAAR